MKQYIVVVTPIDLDSIAEHFFPRTLSVVSETHRWRVYPNVTVAQSRSFRDINGASLGEVHVFPDLGDQGLMVMFWIRLQAEIERRVARGEK